MSKPKSIQIDIPTPCTKSWDEMAVDGNGRHCEHCSKTIIDFTTWSDAELHKFFSKNTGNTCGRFFTTQVNRPIHIPHQPHSRLYRMSMALGLTLLFTQTTALHAQTATKHKKQKHGPPDSYVLVSRAEPHIYFDRTGIIGNSSAICSIHGHVYDASHTALKEIYLGIYFKGKQIATVETDADGYYALSGLLPGRYRIEPYNIGSKTVTVFANKPATVDFQTKASVVVKTEYTTGFVGNPYNVLADTTQQQPPYIKKVKKSKHKA